ncbi:DNA polymerase III subunit psi [Methylophaga sp. OBS3]|uniref:DNA polymerase III subunit psi n=1 Tax=Methylophaga sp. OBS3 TaxID=2991934 RepID=UPI002255922A|nr:DNA polymerase III subunit psi [Methylophaga sp. OBS3]MCX4189285.1 DNA polymerase III subunit psi [Methylophaga sp. OBS3]
MQLSKQQHWALAEMGIPVWRERTVEAVEINELAENVSVTTSSEIWLCSPSTLSPVEQQLMRNIMNVLRNMALAIREVSMADINVSAGEVIVPKQLWFFGDSSVVQSHVLQDVSLELPALSALLANPEQKSQVWQALCRLKELAV